MTEVQEQIFECLRDVSEYGHRNSLHELQAAVGRAEEAAILEVCGVELSNTIPIDEFTDEPGQVIPFHTDAKA